MTWRLSVILLCSVVLLACDEESVFKEGTVGGGVDLLNGKWKANVHYEYLNGKGGGARQPSKVTVHEFFSYGCGHCYTLEPFLVMWAHTQKPDYIVFERVPVSYERLHYTLIALGRDDLIGLVFASMYQSGRELVGANEGETFQKQLRFATKYGISADEFTRVYESEGVTASVKRARELTVQFAIESVPMLIVDGTYKTSVGRAGGGYQLMELINDLSHFQLESRDAKTATNQS